MVWEIYSIGDAAFLTQVLNAVANVTGTGDWRQLVALGLAVGVVLSLVKSAFSSGGLHFQDIFISWLVYATMFAPTTTVSIENVYTGTVRVVANVPVGPAAVGSIVSQVGFKMTRLFEQAFSTPQMTQTGFADVLQTLAAVRRLSISGMVSINEPTAGANLQRSWVNHASECTLAESDIGRRTLDAQRMDPDPWSAMGTDLAWYTTQFFIGGPPQTMACIDAFPILQQYTVTNWLPEFERLMQARVGGTTPAEATARVQAALNHLGGGTVDARTYMVAAVMQNWLDQGMVLQHRKEFDDTAAMMVQQAIDQRNAQWAAESALFEDIVHPMMSYFEAFLFAITPLMVFAVTLGPVGIGLLAKYLVFGLWIQLWMPVLAITNLFITMAATRSMEALNTIERIPFTSFMGIEEIDFVLQKWLATGGMLAASTPAISLMLVYGSAVTATHLAGRLQGGDFVNEKQMSPDVIAPPPAMTPSPLMTHAPLTGATMHGAVEALPQIRVGTEMGGLVASDRTAMETASTSFAHQLGVTGAASAQTSGRSFEQQALGHSFSSSSSATDKAMYSIGERFAQKYSDSGISAEQFAGIIAGNIGAGGQRMGSVSAELRSQFNLGKERAQSIAADIDRSLNTDQTLTASFASGVEQDRRQGVESVFTSGLSKQDTEALSKSAQDVSSAAYAYRQSSTMSQRFGAETRRSVVSYGQPIAENPELRSELDRLISNREVSFGADVERLGNHWHHSGMIADKDVARASAAVALMTGHAQFQHFKPFMGEDRDMKMEGYALLAKVDGSSPAPRENVDPYAQRSLEDRFASMGDTRERVGGSGLPSVLDRTGGLAEDVQDHHRGQENTVVIGRAEVGERYGLARAGVQAEAGNWRKDIGGRRLDHLSQVIHQEATSPRSPAHWTLDEVGGLVAKSAQSLHVMDGAVEQAIGQHPLGALGQAMKIVPGGHAMSQTVEAAAGMGGFLSRFIQERENGADFGSAFSAAWSVEPEGGQNAWEAFTGERVEHAKSLGLTDTQADFYREAMGSIAPDATGLHQALGTDLAQARERLVEEHGNVKGGEIAELLTRSAISSSDANLRLVGEYNQASAAAAGTETPNAPASSLHEQATVER